MTQALLTHSAAPELSAAEFRLFSRLIYERSGISLCEQKIPLVRARLLKRLRALGLTSFRRYYDFITQRDATGGEAVHMLDAISTNQTEFFRDAAHFDFLKNVFYPRWENEPQIRILSAGCSTGEEPYSIAITAREYFGQAAASKVQIGAGDICTKVLAHAAGGVYRSTDVRYMPRERLQAHFLRGTKGYEGLVAVAPEVKSLVQFKYLNLMEAMSVQAHYHAIFCRNVAIYFDQPTQKSVYQKLAGALVKGGMLFLGHSESMTKAGAQFKYVQPAAYEYRG